MAPLLGLLKQGLTARDLAGAVAVGLVCGLFPFLGATTTLGFALGYLFKLNMPVIQAVNYLLSPFQLLMIPVFVRSGAWLLGADISRFTVVGMIRAFNAEPFPDFLRQFGTAGLFALVAWLIVSPLLFAAGYVISRSLIGRLAARVGGGNVA